MDANWASERLEVIRTLMERSAIYRRALAPIMILLGVLGCAASVLGWSLGIVQIRSFTLYWTLVCVAGISGAYLQTRKQALRDSEPFWSPPTKRVTQALLPPIFVGGVGSLLLIVLAETVRFSIWWLPPFWMVLYGCAVHAAGFFMPRGFRLLGWGFVLAGSLLGGVVTVNSNLFPGVYAHLAMGLFFGGTHLLYGVYLYFTETRKNAT